MKLEFYWQSGDSFTADPVDESFVECYVHFCGLHGNNFKPSLPSGQETFKYSNKSVRESIIGLKQKLSKVNKVLVGLDKKMISVEGDIYNQKVLNSIHKQWVMLIREDSGIAEKFHRLGLHKEFEGINYEVHTIESNFRYKLINNPVWKKPNSFNPKKNQAGFYNITMNYAEKGKSSHHKWLNGDDNPNDHELSNWNNIVGSINLHLDPPRVSTYDSDYINYCEKHGIEPTPLFWPIANLNDSDQLARARYVMDINISKKQNALSLRIK